MRGLQISLLHQVLELLKEKALWIEKHKILLIADIHLGKAAHFRKAGLPIPEEVHAQDFLHLKQLLGTLNPEKIYFLGDLFHSSWNQQWEVFESFLSKNPSISFHLIRGNHDIMREKIYLSSLLKIHDSPLKIDNLLLSHEPLDDIPEGYLNICGHIHPGIALRTTTKQKIRIPVFYFSENTLILPSFGNFTGKFMIQPKAEDLVWGVSENLVFPILSPPGIG
ncbi:MAG: ligase-associated DNA damage response endonuclease PdeM [Bacteroidetes bacterium]|nr:ligase-associated DNA damage response endonuclease PdeM [Bacteroidota bacterium]